MFDPKKPTVLLLGRWQPWHDGHLALFKRALAKTGQVVIQVRDVGFFEEEAKMIIPSLIKISKDITEKLLHLAIKLMGFYNSVSS